MIIECILFVVTFWYTYKLLDYIEHLMWKDWFYGKNSWWNILYKNR